MNPIAIEETLKSLVQTLDAIGTFVFALSGTATGVRARLDLFGVLVLSFAAATSGGILRDLLIGAVPPPAIRDWSYLAISIVAGLTTFLFHPKVDRLRTPILVFDAAGLPLFAVSGSQKSLALGMEPVPAMLLGKLTGIGGGIVRDVLANEIPLILRAELYAVAALAGAGVVVAGDWGRIALFRSSHVGDSAGLEAPCGNPGRGSRPDRLRFAGGSAVGAASGLTASGS